MSYSEGCEVIVIIRLSAFVKKMIISVVFPKVSDIQPLSPLLDLVPGQHMVAFTKRAVIKAQLSKTKLLIIDFFPQKFSSTKEPFPTTSKAMF